MNPIRRAGRIIAAAIMAAAVVAAAVDSLQWLAMGALFAALFANA